MNNNCIFCKIVAKTLPSTVVYEDKEFLGFLDINPVVKGHTLLIPKEHHVWMHETPDEIVADSFIATKKLMNAMRKGFKCDYVQISVVGKDVPHFHIHLFPRWLDDGLSQYKTLNYKTKDEQQEIASQIKNSL